MKPTLWIAAAALLPFGLRAFPSAPAAPAALAAPAAPQICKIDPVHSSVVFRVKHMNASWFYGRFNGVSGDFVLDAEHPQTSSIRAEVRAESVDTGNKGRDDHLRSPDFFSAKEFPVIRFESRRVARKGDGFEVEGDLTLHGVTKPVTFLAEHTGTASGRRGTKVGLAAELTFKRSDFGMTYGLPDSLGDEVTVLLGLSGDLEKKAE